MKRKHDLKNPFMETFYEKNARERSYENKFYRLLYLIVTSIPFNLAILLIIIANTVILAIYSSS